MTPPQRRAQQPAWRSWAPVWVRVNREQWSLLWWAGGGHHSVHDYAQRVIHEHCAELAKRASQAGAQQNQQQKQAPKPANGGVPGGWVFLIFLAGVALGVVICKNM